MTNTLIMNVSLALRKSKSKDLADEIWAYKHPGEKIDQEDSEYKSWNKSTRHFLEAAVEAGLENLDVAFEVPTPLGDYIDVVLMGNSNNPEAEEYGRILIVELKQWTTITPIDDRDYVEISVGKDKVDKRRHPVSQICEYESHMKRNHHGIYRKGKIKIDTLAYLHNFDEKRILLSSAYSVWEAYADRVYGVRDKQKLVEYLKDSFATTRNALIPDVLDDCGYIMDEAGFVGLKNALNGKENAKMVKDQTPVVDCVREHLKIQKDNPHKEIIVISGGTGTGKTIIGMHFIYDYADIFNNKKKADGSVFCLPKSRTVKAMIDYECGEEVVPYMDRVNRDQNLVVVDESHRITGLINSLDEIFEKGTKLLIMLQDDHQRIRAGEDGTIQGIKKYAEDKGIDFTPLYLTIQKRCESLGKLLNGLEKMFYDQGVYDGHSIDSVRVFDSLQSMNAWIEYLAKKSRAKFIAPYCWKWNGGTDVQIEDNGYLFRKPWNPGNPKEQVEWHYGANRSEQIASIYTCQGLDLDDVAFIWWDDLVWDEEHKRWKADIGKSCDNMFRRGVDQAGLSKSEIDELFINTYYVMLSRARNKMGIWFKDDATKRHVVSFLGLKQYEDGDSEFFGEDMRNTVLEIKEQELIQGKVIGNRNNKSYHRPECQYAPSNPQKRVEFTSREEADSAGYKPCWTCNP